MKRVLYLGLIVLAGCRIQYPKAQTAASPDYEMIAADAEKASHLFMTRFPPEQQARSLIPPQYWGKAITQLNPIRVEFDNVNVIIVLTETDDYEEGYYCVPMISSYIPADKKNMTFKQLTEPKENITTDISYYRKHKTITNLHDNTTNK